ncbi:MAG: AAA family ATPase [Candidatus Nealsonbacteria bacterium]|nr:AAA family ATPase [Candidatus Nealsonbacteria bacterium]
MKEELIKARKLFTEDFELEVRKNIVGYEKELRQIVICLLSSGPRLRAHILLEGVPGIGKTELAKTIAVIIGGKFNRIQCTPDLLPSDITGTDIWSSARETLEPRKGPVFTNILLVDEINRTTPRTQSALLEAMQEAAVTMGNTTYQLSEPFLVMATQNPIEHEGTFSLPEAQLDRFMMMIRMGYGSKEDERILVNWGNEERPAMKNIIKLDEILVVRSLIRKEVRIDDRQKDYIVELVRATRSQVGISLGGSPRAMMAIEAGSRVHAFLRGDNTVLPDDIDEVAKPILRHRLMIDDLVVQPDKKKLDFIDDLIEKDIIPAVSKGRR